MNILSKSMFRNKFSCSICCLFICFLLLFSQVSFATIDQGQEAIRANIRAYLTRSGADKSFIKKFEQGYCGGLSPFWAYSKWLQTQSDFADKFREDYAWFKYNIDPLVKWPNKGDGLQAKEDEEDRDGFYVDSQKLYQFTVNLILDWDGVRELKKEEKKTFEMFISFVEFFQNVEDYLPIAQGDWDKILRYTKGRDLKREYTLASLFTLEQLKEFLRTESAIQDKKLIYIRSHNHDVVIFKDSGIYYCFDANSKDGEREISSFDEMAKFVFNANGFVEEGVIKSSTPSPLGIEVFSFGGEGGQAYPSQQSILTKINPTLVAQKNYARGFNGLMMAALVDCLESTKYFIEKGVDVNAQSEEGDTALVFAAAQGHVDVANALLEADADPDIQDKNGETALMEATMRNRLEIVKLLLSYDADLELKMDDGQTVFTIAVRTKNTEIIKELLKKKAIPYVYVKRYGRRGHYPNVSPGYYSATYNALTYAIVHGYLDVVDELLDEYGDINIQDSGKNTPLICASIGGYLDLVKKLLQRSAKLDIQSTRGCTALMYAAMHNKLDVVRALLKGKARVNIQDNDGYTALMYAAQNNYLEVVKELLQSGAGTGYKSKRMKNKRNKNFSYKTALMLAELQGNAEVARVLKRYVAEHKWRDLVSMIRTGLVDMAQDVLEEEVVDLDFQDRFGYTALMYAVERERLHIVKEILARGVNLDVQNKAGKTAFILAEEIGNVDVIKELLKKNADLSIGKDFNLTALTYSLKLGYFDVIADLVKEDIDLGFRNEYGDTILILSAKAKSLEAVRSLLDKDFDPDLKNNHGQTALMFAAKNGSLEIVWELLNKGADPRIKNEHGFTAADLVREKKYPEVKKLLLEKIAELEGCSAR